MKEVFALPDHPLVPSRRFVLVGAGALGLTSLASCQSVLPTLTEDGVGASRDVQTKVAALRTANGQSALAADRTLEAAAIKQAEYMSVAGKMDHHALRGRDFVSRMKSAGIAAPAAENIAHGRFDEARVIDVWMESPPHRKNMLDPRFGHFGVGYVPASDGRRYWAMVLAA